MQTIDFSVTDANVDQCNCRTECAAHVTVYECSAFDSRPRDPEREPNDSNPDAAQDDAGAHGSSNRLEYGR